MEIAVPPGMMTTSPRVNNVRYLVRSAHNPSLVFCTDGEFHHQDYIGPGTRKSAKLYRTERGAAAVRGGHMITVHKCDRYGVEK